MQLRRDVADTSLQHVRLVAVLLMLHLRDGPHLLGGTLRLARLGSAAICVHAAAIFAAAAAVCTAVILLHTLTAGYWETPN